MNRLCCSGEPNGCCETGRTGCNGEYIVERVIGRSRQTCCYQGMLNAEEAPGTCPPLYLKAIDVVDIAAICPQRFCACGTQALRLTLMLWIIDGRGCRFQTYAQIDVEVQNEPNRPQTGNVNIRRGARVCIRRAMDCAAAGFDVDLAIEIETIVSRMEFVGHEPCRTPACPPLPLYPPPPNYGFRPECSCGKRL